MLASGGTQFCKGRLRDLRSNRVFVSERDPTWDASPNCIEILESKLEISCFKPDFRARVAVLPLGAIAWQVFPQPRVAKTLVTLLIGCNGNIGGGTVLFEHVQDLAAREACNLSLLEVRKNKLYATVGLGST